MIGKSNGDSSSSFVSGAPLTGSVGSIFLTIPSDFSGSLYYFCTAHTSMVASLQIDTANQAPTNLGTLTSLFIAENEVQGTVVGTFQAQDPAGDSLTYHLTSGVGDGNNSMFTMETNGTLRTAIEFDYESYQTLSIRVKAIDEQNGSVEGTFTVIIGDVDEGWQNSSPENLSVIGNLQVFENQSIGILVGEFNASDPDGDPLTYLLVNGDGDINNHMFTLDENGSLRTAEVFDYESNIVLSIRVAVRDDKFGMISQSFVVKVMDVDEHSTNQPPIDLKPKEDLLCLRINQQAPLLGNWKPLIQRGEFSLFICSMKKE